MDAELATGAVDRGSESLRQRLRHGTAVLHREVELAVDLPASVRTRDDYAALLSRLHGFHAPLERQLAASPWSEHWRAVGVDLERHRRSHLLAADLQGMGAPVPAQGSTPLSIGSFGEALGCLYVLEGSSLGGRVLGPAIRATLGPVPTAFFDSDGRGHPSPWRSLQEALRRFDAGRNGADDVLLGARSTFVAFGRHVAGAAFAEVSR